LQPTTAGAIMTRRLPRSPEGGGGLKRCTLSRQTKEMGVTVFNTTLALACLISLLPVAPASAADLKITDSRGTEVVVIGASIDYSGFMASDKETQGIRVLQGDGTVTVKWSDVESLRITRMDNSVKPPRIEIEIVLRNGKKVPAALLRQGQMKLSGKTELGEYSIDLEKLRSITPVR
jgi:hypothetical protein